MPVLPRPLAGRSRIRENVNRRGLRHQFASGVDGFADVEAPEYAGEVGTVRPEDRQLVAAIGENHRNFPGQSRGIVLDQLHRLGIDCDDQIVLSAFQPFGFTVEFALPIFRLPVAHRIQFHDVVLDVEAGILPGFLQRLNDVERPLMGQGIGQEQQHVLNRLAVLLRRTGRRELNCQNAENYEYEF
ncbi:hypothetical protein SDC9_148392 [bioreactor metagenome]|uniref:Uncharacterized protein n=1 Tax=bioreactor metagenome TaxID=1076179 RepID=A0A645EIA6_9ZZZZ